MRILVTGAGGFAGGHLLEYLQAQENGDELFALARRPISDFGFRISDFEAATDQPFPNPKSEIRNPKSVQWLSADLLNAEETLRAVAAAEPEVIYHLAGHASGAEGKREAIFLRNVDVTRNVLAAAAALRRPVGVMLASTGYVYGACERERPATEEMPLHPHGAYAESKAEMERCALAGTWGSDVRIVIARPFNHTGPRQTPAFAIPAFARQLAEIEAGLAEPVLRAGNLESWRDLSDVRDVVRAYAALIGAGAHGECFNVCSGRAVRMGAVLEELVSLCRVAVRVEPDPGRMRRSDLTVSCGSPGKLESRTGWRAEISLKQTLRDTLDWWRGRAGQR